jgi:hypothetical protein
VVTVGPAPCRPFRGHSGFERRFNTTRVKVLMHATTCPVGCAETRLRTYEGEIVPAPVSGVRHVRDRSGGATSRDAVRGR